jgi:hypothetical protein
MAGIALPPVTLVHVAGAYFVIDGHHRISVARALGQREIEAEVIVWTVATEPAETTAATTSWCSGQMSPLAGTPCITCA